MIENEKTWEEATVFNDLFNIYIMMTTCVVQLEYNFL